MTPTDILSIIAMFLIGCLMGIVIGSIIHAITGEREYRRWRRECESKEFKIRSK